MKKILTFLCAILLVFAVAGPASAAVVTTVGNFNTEAAALQALDNWRGASGTTLLETFESFDTEVPVSGAVLGNTPTAGQSSYTSLGLGGAQFYVDGGLPGWAGGQMTLLDRSNFGVMDRYVAPNSNYGRTLNWEEPVSAFGNQYLDSANVTRISLNHNLADMQLTSLFFFMFDVSDIDGTMIVYMGDGSAQIVGGLVAPQANGGITFMGIQTDGSYISKITWEMNSDHDSFGLDNFGTLNPVPVPASLCFGVGTGRRGRPIDGDHPGESLTVK